MCYFNERQREKQGKQYPSNSVLGSGFVQFEQRQDAERCLEAATTAEEDPVTEFPE